MNLSETAFVSYVSATENQITLNLRWFTPTVEVALCGHATLATSHILLRNGALSHFGIKYTSKITELVFNTRKSGQLIVSASDDGKLRMDFPLGDPKDVTIPQHVLQKLLLNLKVISSADDQSSIRNINLCTKTKKLLLEVVSYDHVKRAVIDYNSILAMDFEEQFLNDYIKGIILTTRDVPQSEEKYDFCSRYFSPWNGIPEDPVNGSGHTVQGKYYSQELGKKDLVAYQASARTGVLYLQVDTDRERIYMSGYAKTVMSGELCL